ncbi:thiopeptide-type bacteriocin biosynthesis protein [Streptomyces sp. NRRL F-5126]|uniref:thiopeptide-type bacteriocin biosynthesis protein n=1 Tax=Streptomyces sp. NRRL F-5126 TaxID=1463857 RepID=UPI00099C05BC|nr:thiopeptide-type bacteriocin biosynthesis protein [Streptomyces sp. NRRL F-5126]
MNETPWKQVNIAYPGAGPREREPHAVAHLARILPRAEAGGLITAWFFIRKGPWRIRYLPAIDNSSIDPVHPLLTAGVTWTPDIYEPEVHGFGGPGSMDAAHTLFHQDSRHLLSFLSLDPADRQEHSLVLCTALMRAAGLDSNEQGDAWARVAEQRAGLFTAPSDARVWASFVGDVRRLLLGTARTDAIASDWLKAFEDTGTALRTLREQGNLTRGIRAVIALHVIFHFNRIGLTAITQAALAQAAKQAVFGTISPLRGTAVDGPPKGPAAPRPSGRCAG